ncbi:MAG: ABC-ATPase domain-containing protein [Eubacterium sp.]|nr:ABC-ATPase domain-containing protein [Eubacterium sp.]
MKQSKKQLTKILGEIDNKSYPAYKQLKGSYDMTDFVLIIEHVQGDPFASPSMVSVEVPSVKANFPKNLYDNEEKKVALEDLLLRQFSGELRKYSFQAKGSGKSGFMGAVMPGPEILKRTGCEISGDGTVRVRFEAGFPANGRRINSRELEKMLVQLLPKVVLHSLYYDKTKERQCMQSAQLAEDQKFIREELKKRNLVAFVANGAILPRESGVSSRPMKNAVTFQSPKSLEITLQLPNRGEMKGMGIPQGITMIVGGGFHGKSTLLKALEVGVYNHVAGDGREYVITDDSAVKLRAEDGRSIQKVDISMFINNLPNGKDTSCFSTEDASGSTSQAANVVEAMEAGSHLFLVDEDTSATNFMIRDELMQKVVHSNMEPITPFSLRVRQLYKKVQISTILVAGSSGSYFYEADHIIQMKEYQPEDITEMAKSVAQEFASLEHENKAMENEKVPEPFIPDFSKPRIWLKKADMRDRVKMKVMGRDSISINKETIDLRYVEQLVDTGQLAGLANIVWFIRVHFLAEDMSMTEMVNRIEELLNTSVFEKICAGKVPGNLTVPRKQEIFECLNRWRGE